MDGKKMERDTGTADPCFFHFLAIHLLAIRPGGVVGFGWIYLDWVGPAGVNDLFPRVRHVPRFLL